MGAKERILESLAWYRAWKDAEAEYKEAVSSGDDAWIQSALEKAAGAYVAYQSVRQPGEEEEL